ncbi:flagellar biosynthesis GTPase FlhF [Leucobacter exalbidus]|uniref:Flagellar biosynthesis GTPase FlhF n=1 Tax=Leucobacter exalbidus TaxID=662960 RepID=A0A940PRU3_9MICO|nr:hypothetical protein [Leucobacter exalbidus]MBP1325070.1 flagellar biosynthesis GTPase FlhF [Leucobacter exalbidus]
MAQPKIDKREVQKIKSSMASNGEAKTARRFNEHSPEFQKVTEQRQQRKAQARKGQAAHFQNSSNTNQKGNTMSQPTQKAKPATQTAKAKPAAQQRAAKKQPMTAGQQKAAQMKQSQNRQNSRLAQAKSKSQSQTQSM